MNITFCGATREVTGSMHLMANDTDRILLDCGLYQGRRKETEHKNRTWPFDPQIITNVILSHAHLDHSGRLPVLAQRDFNGRILCSRATAAACGYLLRDSAHIQESDADYLNYKTVRAALHRMKTSPRTHKVPAKEIKKIRRLLKGDNNQLQKIAIHELIDRHQLTCVQPLYSVADAENALDLFEGLPYRHPVQIGRGISCTLYDAGHILGSAISVFKAHSDGRGATLVYSGDLGRFGKPIVKDPTLNFAPEDRQVDLLILESTYGGRCHEPVADLAQRLEAVLTDTHARGGSVIIPAFAFGRTQELLYVLHQLYDARTVPRLPIYVDSPLATRLTRVFGEHPEVYDQETHADFLEQGKNPFRFDQIHFVRSVAESMELMRDTTPHIVLSASGMCEAGRILHHLRYHVHNPRDTILIVGYMAENTLGRRILELGRAYEKTGRSSEPPVLKFFNKSYPLKARVVSLDGFSAHADQNDLLHFLDQSNLRIKEIALVHGEEAQARALADTLHGRGFSVRIPRAGETIRVRWRAL